MDQASIHASFLLLMATISLLVIAGTFVARRQAQLSNERFRLIEVLPLLLIGLVFSLTLNMNGFPLIEWIVPSLAASVLMARTSRRRNRFRICCVYSIVSGALCLHFMSLITQDFTAVPDQTLLLERFRQAAIVSQGKRILSKHVSSGGAVHPGPLSESVRGDVPTASRVTVTRTWHSWLTRLYRIERHPLELWVTQQKSQKSFDIELHNRI